MKLFALALFSFALSATLAVAAPPAPNTAAPPAPNTAAPPAPNTAAPPAPNTAAPPAPRTFEVPGDMTEMKAEVEDGETVRLLLPYVEKAEPRAEIVEESLIYDGRCEVLSVRNEAPKVEMLFRMPSTVADSGFNGCRAVIDRGTAGDNSDQFRFDYGYEILD